MIKVPKPTLPLDVEYYIPETDVAFTVYSLVEAISQVLFHQVEQQLGV